MRELMLACLAVGCGGAHGGQAREAQAFECRSRLARYVVTHHLAGNELGVEVDCAVEGPRIRRWRVDRDGNRSEDAHSLTPVQFDALWKDVDATGWPNLRSCSNGSHDKRDPLYRFTIKDDVAHAAFQCQARAMPFPYSGLVDPLDLAAQDGHGQLGDDEPAAAKALAPEARRE